MIWGSFFIFNVYFWCLYSERGLFYPIYSFLLTTHFFTPLLVSRVLSCISIICNKIRTCTTPQKMENCTQYRNISIGLSYQRQHHYIISRTSVFWYEIFFIINSVILFDQDIHFYFNLI